LLFEHFAAAAADSFENDADEVFGDVDHQALDGARACAVFAAHDDFGLANINSKLRAHGFDQMRAAFAATEHAE